MAGIPQYNFFFTKTKKKPVKISEKRRGDKRNVHEQLLVGVTFELGLVIQSFGPSFLGNRSAGFRGRLWTASQ